MTTERLRPSFVTRHVQGALSLVGLVVAAPLIGALVDRLLLLTDKELSTRRLVISAEAAVLLAAHDDLPWIDGAVYLVRRGELLLPSVVDVDVPLDALAQAICRTHPDVRLPVVVDPSRQWLLSVASARAPDRPSLAELRQELA